MSSGSLVIKTKFPPSHSCHFMDGFLKLIYTVKILVVILRVPAGRAQCDGLLGTQ